ncbi:hypothetical protein D9756_007111 [Leucocoprinus leucothites]|uniref:NACHT domain-containing protein n=1 Tax=Leucocoprinus leucothites TaxID=201217 RepID=A0A8H5D644_9AGAR|nr:hypothetical protein D9756_007111 [Leucoagaricus leucothites]
MSSPGSLAEAVIQGDNVPPSTRIDRPPIVHPRREDEHNDQSSSNGEREMVATTALPVLSSYKYNSGAYYDTARSSTSDPSRPGDSRRDGCIPPSAAPMLYRPQQNMLHRDTSPTIPDGTPTTTHYGDQFSNAHDFVVQSMTNVFNHIQPEEARKAEEYERWRKAEDERQSKAEYERRRKEEDERWRKAEEAIQKLDAKKLQSAMLDAEERGYVPRCNEDTRQSLRGQIVEWGQMGAVVERILWLSGPAGVGKSAIAQTVAEEMGRILGAVFFFSRPNKRDDPNVVIPTLVYQLAVLLPEYKLLVGQRFKEDPSIFGKSRRSQFESLISDPFLSDLSQRPLTLLSHLSEQLFTSLSHRPLLIVLDGLDECNGRDAQREFVEMIACHAQKDKASRLRWMVCSRPEPHLAAAFSSIDCQGICRHERLEIDDDGAQKDALHILRAGFADIRKRYSSQLARDWPHDGDVTFIADRASGHLGFASSIIRFIGDHEYDNPSGQLKVCLKFLERTGPNNHVNPLHPLDLLYTQILSDIPVTTLPTTQLVLGLLILYGNERLTALVHANFLGLDQATFYHSLQRLHSAVLVPPASEASTKPIRVYHASFSDYLRDKVRAGKFVLDEGAVHLYVANRGLQWLSHCCKEPSDQQALPELTWPEGPTSPDSQTVLDSVCEFAFTPCWRAFPQVPKASLSSLIEALKKFDFNIPYVKSEDEVRAFAYFIQWLMSSDAKSLAFVNHKHPNKPGKKKEIAIVWDEEYPHDFVKPFGRNARPITHLSIHLQLRTRTKTSFHLITSTDIKDMCQLREDDILIAFMGQTGTGKSHFIDLLTGQEGRRSGHSLASTTSDIQATRTRRSGYDHRVVLVDTPPFNHTHKSEMEVLILISNWFARTYKNNIKLSGIIYLHRIIDTRVAPFEDLRVFGDLCGDRAAARVTFVSTMWDDMNLRVYEEQETRLKQELWKAFIHRGSRVDRLRNSTTQEAWRIVEGLIETADRREAILLQEEIVDLGWKLSETTAGRALHSDLQERVFRQKKLLERLSAQIGKSNNLEVRAVLERQRKETERESERMQKLVDRAATEVKKMKIPKRRWPMLLISSARPRSKPIKIE